jgi:glycerol uptake facilitator-like aquaporin
VVAGVPLALGMEAPGCGDAAELLASAGVGDALVAAFCWPVLFETTESLLQAASSEMTINTVSSLIRDTFACEFIVTFMILPNVMMKLCGSGYLLSNPLRGGRV